MKLTNEQKQALLEQVGVSAAQVAQQTLNKPIRQLFRLHGVLELFTPEVKLQAQQMRKENAAGSGPFAQ